MFNINQISSILQNHRISLTKKYHIKELGVFGSYSRNEQKENSDIDILVEFEKPIGLDFVLLAEELEKILDRKVDLVSKNAIKPRVWEYIKKDLKYV